MDMPPGERLLTIGEFSRLSRISIRMLRHYDDHGVLRPTRVDPFSGYRSYAPGLLRIARRVRELRDVGVPVAELAACIPLLDDVAAMRAVLERQRVRLGVDAAAVADRIRGVDRLVSDLEERLMSIDIAVRTLPAHTVASLRDTIPSYRDEGLLWQRLMAALPVTGAVPSEAAIGAAVFHDEGYLESGPDVEVWFEVTGPFTSVADAACVQVPEQQIASGMLHGPYEGIDLVFEAIGDWVSRHEYRFAGPMFDLYVVGPNDTPDPAQWLTEVCAPVVVAEAPTEDAAPAARELTGDAR